MTSEKTGSVNLDRYKALTMDNQAYVNMPELEDYLNPISSDKIDRKDPVIQDTPPTPPRLSGTPPRLSDTPPRLSDTPPRLSDTPPRLSDTPPTPPRLSDTPPTPPRLSNTPPTPPRNSTSSSLGLVRKETSEFKPRPPQTPAPSKPPPPQRSASSASKLGQDGSLSKPKSTNSFKYPKMGNGFTSLERNAEKQKVFLRQKNSAFDSGVGDLEHVHIDGMHQNKQYDYAEFGHQYEELPSRKGTQKNFNMDSGMDSRSELYQSSGGATDITSETEDTANIVNSRSEKRKRVNPLYDAMTQSMPSIYNKNKPATDEGLRNQIRCLKCVVIILVVLCLASIAVSIYAVLRPSNAKVEQDPFVTNEIQKLSQDYSRLEDLLSSFDDNNDTMKVLSDLIKRVNTMEHNVTSQIGDLKSDIASVEHNINVITQEVSDINTNISSQISLLNMTIQLQLHNISKMEGPMGPQGVANFSRCSYYNISNDAVASDIFPSYSPYAPTEIDLERNIALYAACSVENGAREELEVQAITPQKVQYRCKCSGVVQGQPRRICRVHIVVCPRNS